MWDEQRKYLHGTVRKGSQGFPKDLVAFGKQWQKGATLSKCLACCSGSPASTGSTSHSLPCRSLAPPRGAKDAAAAKLGAPAIPRDRVR